MPKSSKKKPYSPVLTYALNKPWFDMIKSGVKTEEYREIKTSYINRFLEMKDLMADYRAAGGPDDREMAVANAISTGNWKKYLRKFTKLVLTLGYPSKTDSSRRLEFDEPSIRIGQGKPEWGAEPRVDYFIITWKES